MSTRSRKIDFRFRAIVANTTPVHAYRGAARPEASALVERIVDMLAARLGLDPVTVRRRNYIKPDESPYTTPTGARYDSGDYETSLDLALQMAGYDALRAEQIARRATGDPRLLGIGVASYVEVTAAAGLEEWGAAEVHADGTVTVRLGTSSHGQGHETAFAQVAAAELLRHIAVDDAGEILNRYLVDGPVHGGIAQGAGQTLFEEVRYDEWANPLTVNLVTYLVPTAANLPLFEVAHTVTPTPLNEMGVKGIGEAATVGLTPAIQNAVIDALSHLGVEHIDMPFTPSRVWGAMANSSS